MTPFPAGPLPEERLPYEKPTLRSISLRVDQVLGTGCKNSPPVGGISNGSDPALGCFANKCSVTPGS